MGIENNKICIAQNNKFESSCSCENENINVESNFIILMKKFWPVMFLEMKLYMLKVKKMKISFQKRKSGSLTSPRNWSKKNIVKVIKEILADELKSYALLTWELVAATRMSNFSEGKQL